MATKSKKTGVSFSFVKGLVLLAILVFIVFVAGQMTFDYLKKSGYFNIKDIWYESSLKSIESTELSNLKGKNLLEVNLNKIQRQLQLRYPQYGQLKVLKRFPNQVLVLARQRVPFAQAKIQGHLLTIDERGVILALSGELDNALPLIVGVNTPKGRMAAGALIESKDLQLALGIIRECRRDRILSSCPLNKVDVGNLSEIYFYIFDDLKIIIDQENYAQKLKVLGLVLSQAKVKVKDVNYIDLRFKEPILGKK